MPRTRTFAAALATLSIFASCGRPRVDLPARTTLPPSPSRPTNPTPAATIAPPAGLVQVDQSIVVRLRYATSNNFTEAPLPGYEADRAFLRPAAATALLSAERSLRRRGYTIVVLD